MRTLDKKLGLLISQLARYSSAMPPGAHGLSQSQAAALSYFRHANRISRTISSFAAFQAITVGSASSVVNRLVRKGYLRKERSKSDRRTVYVDVTAVGGSISRYDPMDRVARVARTFRPEDQRALINGLERILIDLADFVNRPRFGVCRECRYLVRRRRLACALHEIDLSASDLDRICAYFAPEEEGDSERPASVAAGRASDRG